MRDCEESQKHLNPKETIDLQNSQEKVDVKDLKDILVLRAPLETMEHKDNWDHLDPKEAIDLQNP